MTSGRYTAYHVYQDLTFQEAEKAGTRPYRLDAYQCPHSQRGYLFQFSNMVERIHFDAATTSCCDEPVLNFASKPQYAESTKPMKPKDCRASVATHGCTIVEVEALGKSDFCADESEIVRRVRVRCPSQCYDLAQVMHGGTLEGRYGRFEVIGLEEDDQMILDYRLDDEVADDFYNACSGMGVLSEDLCGGFRIGLTLRAGIDYPRGCGCDCCGVHGAHPPPVMVLSVPSSVQGDWTETVDLSQTISGDESCDDGSIAASFSGAAGGSTPVNWAGDAQFHTNGVNRYVTRDAQSAGSSSVPGCCGGSILWSGTDGCGDGAIASTAVVSPMSGSSIVPPSGTLLYESGGASFSGVQACTVSPSAFFDLSGTCLANSGTTVLDLGYFYKGVLSGSLTFASGYHCSGCCGSGTVYVSFNNGCGGTIDAAYDVRRPVDTIPVVGHLFRCDEYDWDSFKVARADLPCQGESGSFDYPSATGYDTLAECIEQISGTSGRDISGSAGCGGTLSGSSTCCWYADNGQSGLEFRSWIYALSGRTCCVTEGGVSGGWVNSGSGALCCPLQ